MLSRLLHDAASHSYLLPPKKPTFKRRAHHFIQGGEPKDTLTKFTRNDIVWCLVPYAQLLKEHGHIEMEVLKKYHKKGVVAVRVVGGPTIRKGATRPSHVSPTEYYEAYQWVNDYLSAQGITFSSFSWASEQALRIQLKKPIHFANPIGRRLLKTSRGVCFPGLYQGPIEKWDIRGAYPYAMLENAHQFPTRLTPIHEAEWEQYPSLVFAYVHCRPSDTLRIPVIQEHPTDTDNPNQTFDWFFDFELRTILEQGHYVKPITAFRIRTIDLSDELGRWHELFSPRYESDLGFRGKLLKAIANALWGTFSSSEMASFTWELDTASRIQPMEWVRGVYPGKVGAEHVAAWVNALVSDRVFNEVLLPYDVIYFDTDGGFIRGHLPDSIGNGNFGAWRYEGTTNKLDVVGWQAYAAYNDDGIKVTLSGVPNASLADLKRFGGSEDRQGAIQNLMENKPMSRVAGVHRTDNRLTMIPPAWVGGMERTWLPIDFAISPDVSLFTVSNDQWEVSEGQANAFRKISIWGVDTFLDSL